jgi:DNA repair exonuclease SbcCD nuclease subunit
MKIDVTKIENYDNMTDSEKLEAVLNYEMEAPAPEPVADNGETQKLRDALNKASSQAADYKRQLHEKMSADELAKAQREERENALREELESLRRERTVSNYTTSYLAMGYDAETAKSLAANLPDGLGEEFFSAQKNFLDSRVQQIRTEILNSQPQPTAGAPLTSKSAEDLELAQLRKWSGLNN